MWASFLAHLNIQWKDRLDVLKVVHRTLISREFWNFYADFCIFSYILLDPHSRLVHFLQKVFSSTIFWGHGNRTISAEHFYYFLRLHFFIPMKNDDETPKIFPHVQVLAISMIRLDKSSNAFPFFFCQRWKKLCPVFQIGCYSVFNYKELFRKVFVYLC